MAAAGPGTLVERLQFLTCSSRTSTTATSALSALTMSATSAAVRVAAAATGAVVGCCWPCSWVMIACFQNTSNTYLTRWGSTCTVRVWSNLGGKCSSTACGSCGLCCYQGSPLWIVFEAAAVELQHLWPLTDSNMEAYLLVHLTCWQQLHSPTMCMR